MWGQGVTLAVSCFSSLCCLWTRSVHNCSQVLVACVWPLDSAHLAEGIELN